MENLVEELEVFRSLLADNDLRFTEQREIIAKYIFSAHDHFSAEELFERIHRENPDVSRATVYRTLALLRESHLVEELDMGDGQRHYEHVIGHCHHDHMICQKCQRVIEFQNEEIEKLQDEACEKEEFLLTSHSLRIYGICKECQSEESE